MGEHNVVAPRPGMLEILVTRNEHVGQEDVQNCVTSYWLFVAFVHFVEVEVTGLLGVVVPRNTMVYSAYTGKI